MRVFVYLISETVLAEIIVWIWAQCDVSQCFVTER